MTREELLTRILLEIVQRGEAGKLYLHTQAVYAAAGAAKAIAEIQRQEETLSGGNKTWPKEAGR